MGNNTGERRPQKRMSPCHKYSFPLAMMLASSAPWSVIWTVILSFESIFIRFIVLFLLIFQEAWFMASKVRDFFLGLSAENIYFCAET
ncbi:hypothetical protein BACCOPRO_00961 [Phocaeicola coprophilus DSM 18228 = JCM 13818]|uniref:Uncharacterized protein n=1 Tax=Phocaeicola coprophilus DSM 18228 = JCM 13818 TaxID=547042 RepID=S0F6Z8_9BACT|nr:hypothetical protein BACCOPRO_00961 [Phocaeicola coprophilus DSM 18228 = JCM 13818]